ncbi:unnamed protein product [Calypogeia fissa]
MALGEQPVIFQYDGNGLLEDVSLARRLGLQVQNDPNAKISDIQEGDMMSSEQFDGNLTTRSGNLTSYDTRSGMWLYKNPVKLSGAPNASAATSFSTMFDFQVDLDEQYDQNGNLQNYGMTTGSTSFVICNSTEVCAQGGAGDSLSFEVVLGTDIALNYEGQVKLNIFGTTSMDVTTMDFGHLIGRLQRIAVTTWIEYHGPTQTLEVFTSATGDAECNANLTDYPIVCKPVKPIISLSDVDLTAIFPQDGTFVGLRSYITYYNYSISRTDCRINWWTFNSDGPAPDFPRDSDGFLMDFEKEKLIEKRAKLKKVLVTLAITIPPVLLFLFLVFIISVLCWRVLRLSALAKKYEIEKGLLDQGPQNFKYRVLSSATKGFNSGELLGSGGFGSVYRGKLVPKGCTKPSEVAVKRISSTSRQGAQEFLAEVKIIGRMQHRNLVRLLGWCHQQGELLLVYDYMPNGSLDQLLYKKMDQNHSQGGEPVLTWARRLRIVFGVATALAFLHEEWEHRVIHRDVKSSNVMLDKDFNARLGDFGLARMYKHGQAPPSTAVLAGTLGYLAPEILHTLKFTEKTDVYSFGTLVLEVATGKKPLLGIDSKTYDELFLVDWVWGLYSEDKLLDAADCRLQNAYDQGEMLTFLKLGLLCSHPDANERPTMRDVINIWKGSSSLPELPKSKPVRFYAKSLSEEAQVVHKHHVVTINDRCSQPEESRAQDVAVESDNLNAFTIRSKDDGGNASPQENLVGQNLSSPPCPTLEFLRAHPELGQLSTSDNLSAITIPLKDGGGNSLPHFENLVDLNLSSPLYPTVECIRVHAELAHFPSPQEKLLGHNLSSPPYRSVHCIRAHAELGHFPSHSYR